MIQPKLHVDLTWMNRISYSLDRFSKNSDSVYNCRCPICGDSTRDPKKKRFYLLVRKGKLSVYCHKCGYSKSFYGFMKDKFPSLFDEYKRETLFDSFTRSTPDKPKSVVNRLDSPTENKSLETIPGIPIDVFQSICTPIISLDKKHPARMMLVNRGMSVREMNRLYYTDDFKSVAEKLNSTTTTKLKESEPRILIPFTTPQGRVEMLQGRSLDPESKLRYISIKANDDVEKVYGRYELDETEIVTCVEGPLDSLFVDNAIATCDANLTRVEADRYCWDCQPRQKDIIRYMDNAIEAGKSVVIWPFIPNKKLDINDMILGGMNRNQLMSLINRCTYSGLMAKAKFTQWKKL